jgi:hypothetical protein
MKVVPGYSHNPGIHCGSAAMRNLVRFLGRDFPEEILFGLGEGLSFIYVEEQSVPPYIAIHGRTLDLEKVLAHRLGLTFDEDCAADSEGAWEYCRNSIDSGYPVLINTDIRFLDYFSSGTHFSGHRVVLAGYDDGGIAYISDSEFPALMELPLTSLTVARESMIPPFSMPNCSAVIRGVPELPDDPMTGLPGMLRAIFDMPGWHEKSQTPDFAARFAYQVIEKRGTGGGFFRNMYTRFLIYLAGTLKPVRTSGLIDDMNEIASGWSRLALYFRDLSDQYSPSGFNKGAEYLAAVADLEERYHRKVLNLFT